MKLLDHTIKSRIDTTLKKAPISFTQIGFRKGLGTEVNLNQVIQTIHKCFDALNNNTEQDPWLFFIDFKGAFNGVDHKILYEKIKNKGLENSSLNLIKFYFNQLAFIEDNQSW